MPASDGLQQVSRVTCSVTMIVLVAVVGWYRMAATTGSARDLLSVPSEKLADESSCVNCHDQAVEFQRTGHANTLTRADSKASRSLLSSLNSIANAQAEGTTVSVTGDRPLVAFDSALGEGTLALDWCFGSGRHARTWVATLADSQGATDLLEFRWSWYSSLQSFDITPGQPPQHFATYLGPCGVFYDQPKARRCFACHSTSLPIDDGRLRFEEHIPGVTCQRCHGPRARHVESEGEIRDDFWQAATAKDAVDRCAQCHRNADEVEIEDLRPDNPELARFQPIGLVQSACFCVSGKLTCTTCHDPHRPLEAQDSLGTWQCTQCHNPSSPQDTHCAAGQSDDCLSCHMPKVQANDPLLFTDHWIRVR